MYYRTKFIGQAFMIWPLLSKYVALSYASGILLLIWRKYLLMKFRLLLL